MKTTEQPDSPREEVKAAAERLERDLRFMMPSDAVHLVVRADDLRIALAALKATERPMTPKRRPIEQAPKDGRTLLVMDGDWIAVAHWAGDMWARGHQEDCRPEGPRPVEQIEFDPTHFSDPKDFHLSDLKNRSK